MPTVTYDEYCQFIEEGYEPLHPHLYKFTDTVLAPKLAAAMRRQSHEALRSISQEIHPGVVSFDMLQPKFCAELLEEMDHFESWCASVELGQIRPNTMNNYGTVLDSMGFSPLMQQMMTEWVGPFASMLYADVGGGSLDRHHGFIVDYAIGKDTSLDFHVDESDVTLNVCLGKQFTGGELYFGGVRCRLCQETLPLPGEEFDVVHAPGRAILHRGKHRHAAKPITSGDRSNLILWCNSSRHARQKDDTRCQPWCGRFGKPRDD
jgi:hypothetical protein